MSSDKDRFERELAATRRELLSSAITIAVVSAGLGAIGLIAANIATEEWDKYRYAEHKIDVSMLGKDTIKAERQIREYPKDSKLHIARIRNVGVSNEDNLKIRVSVAVPVPFEELEGYSYFEAADNTFIFDGMREEYESNEPSSYRKIIYLDRLQPGESFYIHLAVTTPVNFRVDCRNNDSGDQDQTIQWSSPPASEPPPTLVTSPTAN